MKLCWWCKYFYYSQATDAFETSEEEFGTMLSKAETCPDFKQEPK